MDAKSLYNNVLCNRIASFINKKNLVLSFINSLINLTVEIMNYYDKKPTISIKKLDFNFFRHNLHNVNKRIVWNKREDIKNMGTFFLINSLPENFINHNNVVFCYINS